MSESCTSLVGSALAASLVDFHDFSCSTNTRLESKNAWLSLLRQAFEHGGLLPNSGHDSAMAAPERKIDDMVPVVFNA